MEFLRKFRRVKILGVSHFPKELPAPVGEPHPVRFDALSQSCIEVLFHATKVRKRFNPCKYNRLNTNVLNAVFGHCGEIDTLSHGETYGNYLSAPARLTGGDKRLIFSGPKRNLTAWGYF